MNRVKHVWDPLTKTYVPETPSTWKRLQEKTINIYTRIREITAVQWIFFVSFVLRLWQLGKGAFWYDEGVSIVLARLPWSNMIQATAGDVHPPGYYIILWIMDHIGIPMTEGVARFPSLVFSMIAIYLTWKLVNHESLNMTKTGKYIVLVWVAISPLQLHYAQESRMYALLQVEVLSGILFILNRQKALVSVVILSMLYTHNYAVFYAPVFALVVLMTDYVYIFDVKTSMKYFVMKWLPYFVVPFLLWIPWLIVLFGQMDTVSGGYWIQPVTIPSIVFALYQMLFAYSMPTTFQGLGVLLTCGVLLYTAWRIYKDQPKNWLVLVVLAFGPLMLAVFLSIVWKPVLLFRGLIGTTVPLNILIVKAMSGIRFKYKQVYAFSIIGITLVAGMVGHYTYNAENKGTTTTWVHEIVDQLHDGDIVVALNDNGVIAMKTYAPNTKMYKLKGCGAEPWGSLSPGTRTAIGIEERSLDQLIPLSAGKWEPLQIYSRVFFISTVAPISPECEIDMANEIIALDNTRLIHELVNDEYAQAGIYIVLGDKY